MDWFVDHAVKGSRAVPCGEPDRDRRRTMGYPDRGKPSRLAKLSRKREEA